MSVFFANSSLLWTRGKQTYESVICASQMLVTNPGLTLVATTFLWSTQLFFSQVAPFCVRKFWWSTIAFIHVAHWQLYTQNKFCEQFVWNLWSLKKMLSFASMRWLFCLYLPCALLMAATTKEVIVMWKYITPMLKIQIVFNPTFTQKLYEHVTDHLSWIT